MLNILYASASQPGAEAGNPIMSLLPFLVIILIMYFLMIRPQAKKQKAKQKMLENLKAGDEILTIGGIYGRIEGINDKDNKLIVSIAKDTKVNLSRSAVADKVERT
ncbi:MAG: preprotein translocase subunit YajC [Fidelibacterota bacterium]